MKLGRFFLLLGKAKEKFASAAASFPHFRSYRKIWLRFFIQIYLKNMSRHWLPKFRKSFEKIRLLMWKISIFQNLEISFFSDMKLFFVISTSDNSDVLSNSHKFQIILCSRNICSFAVRSFMMVAIALP